MVISFLNYKEIAILRGVNNRLNVICQKLLNQGFERLVDKYGYEEVYKDSAKRDLAYEVYKIDIGFANMIDLGLCCFFPGKLLDSFFAAVDMVEIGAEFYIDENWKLVSIFTAIEKLGDRSVQAVRHLAYIVSPPLVYKKNIDDLKMRKKLRKKQIAIKKFYKELSEKDQKIAELQALLSEKVDQEKQSLEQRKDHVGRVIVGADSNNPDSSG